jgi:hypothetical protein
VVGAGVVDRDDDVLDDGDGDIDQLEKLEFCWAKIKSSR